MDDLVVAAMTTAVPSKTDSAVAYAVATMEAGAVAVAQLVL